MISDFCIYKKRIFEIGWSGEEVNIPRLTIKPEMTLNKKRKTINRINKILKALSSKKYDKLIWLKGVKGQVWIKIKLIFVIILTYFRSECFAKT